MEPASVERRHRHPRRAAGSGAKPLHLSRSSRRFAAYAEHMAAEGSPTPSLARLADEMRESADELALEVIEEGLTEDQLPSLERLGREGQLSDTPTCARSSASPRGRSSRSSSSSGACSGASSGGARRRWRRATCSCSSGG